MGKQSAKKQKKAPDPSAGGRAVVEQLGVEHMSKIAGGKVTFKRYGREHYVRMAKAAAASRKKISDAGRKALGM